MQVVEQKLNKKCEMVEQKSARRSSKKKCKLAEQKLNKKCKMAEQKSAGCPSKS
jgi:hypothetical protein